LLDFSDFPLLVYLDLVVSVNLLCLSALVSIELQQEELSQSISPFLDLVIAGELSRNKFDIVLIGKL
jgi:hypothetical protein